MPVCPPAARGDRRDGRQELPDRDAGAGDHDAPRRGHRRPPGEDAAEIDVLLPEDPDWDGLQLAEEGLTGWVHRRKRRSSFAACGDAPNSRWPLASLLPRHYNL